MPIVKITGQGLTAIALSVGLLWGCWLEQRSLLRHDYRERARVMRDLQQLQQLHSTPAPAFAPNPTTLRTPRVTAG